MISNLRRKWQRKSMPALLLIVIPSINPVTTNDSDDNH
jgi:hypothetical protein